MDGVSQFMRHGCHIGRAPLVVDGLREPQAFALQHDGLWATPSGTDGIYIASVRALVQIASIRPAMASRAVFIVGDAERMVSQIGSDQAANAFLKLASLCFQRISASIAVVYLD